MNISFATLSETGPRRANEDFLDCWLAASGDTVACVADGLGGMGGGDVASKLAVQTFRRCLDEHGIDAEKMQDAIHAAHHEILKAQMTDIKYDTMATTLTAAALEGNGVTGVHCGDTRAVLVRQGELRQLTKDHSPAQRQFDAGAITEEEFMHHRQKHLLDSALGVSTGLRIDAFHSDLLPGDRLLLTSDGVHDLLFPRDIQPLMSTAPTPEALNAQLAAMIEERGPKDNYSMIAIFAD